MFFKKGLTSLTRQSTDSHRLKVVKKNKAHNGAKFTESLDYVYYCILVEVFDCEGAKYRKTFYCMGCQAKPACIL